MDGSLSGSGDRAPRRPRRQCPPSKGDGDGDMDTSEQFERMTKKDPPRRSLSSELDSSLVIGDTNWRKLDTVHKSGFADFEDSDSLMDDSFAGSSFATLDSVADEAETAKSQFTTLDDEPLAAPEGAGKASPSHRSTTPRRTYSKQAKRMPKKSAPMSAISETDDSASVES